MTVSDFLLLVDEMRETQKEYFRTKDKDVLAKSKSLEKQVDEYLIEVVTLIKDLKDRKDLLGYYASSSFGL